MNDSFDNEPTAPEAVAAPPIKKDWGAWAVKNKMYVFGVLVAVIMLACGVWVWMATQEAEASAPGIAGSTSSMNSVVSTPVVVDPAAPTDALDQKAADEQSAKYGGGAAAPGPDEFLAQQNAATGSGVQDTAALASFRRAQRLEAQQKRVQQNQIRDEYVATAQERNTVTEMETRRDPSTGQYTQQPVKVHRSQAYSSGFVGAGSGTGVVRQKPRPVRDRDGVAFETNDDVNEMLAGAGVAVQENYEKMTGRRYRPLDRPGTMDAGAKAAMMYVPGMDGFNTVKYRGASADPAEELEQALVPDVFYRCLINGHQNVRTGSVVLLRLSEDATIGGVVFPRNMVFAAVASVESNHVALIIDRLGPHRVKAEVFNYNYMPGIMIDPEKRPKPEGGQSMASGMQQSGFQEMSSAIDRSASAANSPTGIAGRMGVAMLNRIPPAGRKLREVLLPDGYPVLITTSIKAAGGSAPARTAAGGPTGQDGNPMQSPFMSGVGMGGYSGQPRSASGY